MGNSAAADDLTVEGLSVYADLEDIEDIEEERSMRLRDVGLRLRRGEWVALVGVNGSGKSTLARALAGLPVDGAIGAVRRGFAGAMPAAYVMQQPDAQLFGETPREELAFALEWLGTPAEEIDRLAVRWLERAGLAALADEPWARLSGGQRQLAAVAAAAAGGSPLVVLDEATSMLDGAAAERVQAMARELQADGAAIVWVTQRLEELAPDMRVVALRDGRIAFDGRGREFLYGRDPLREEPPCVRCGLRLPYLAGLAVALLRSGRREQRPDPQGSDIPALEPPMTEAEWRDWRERWLEAGGEPETLRAQGFDGTLRAVVEPAERGELTLRGGAEAGWELRLRGGEIAVLLGSNGAGKTSLLEQLAGLRDPEGMDVAYGGEPLRRRRKKVLLPRGGWKLNAEALKRYAYASQSPEELLVRRSAEEELREVLRPYRLDEAAMSARMASALAAVGWDESWLRKDPYRMSGGERRRLALACLFAVPAAWLLADEPTAGLDAAGQELVAAELNRQRDSGAGVLLVSHDAEWALPLADRALLLSPDGALRDCTRDELLRHPEWWAEAGMEVPAWLKAVGRLRTEEKEPSPVPCSRRIERFRPRQAADEALQAGRLGFALTAFDPRAVWLAYVLLALAMFSRHGWPSLAMAGVVTAAAAALSRMPLLRWRGPIVGYALFSLAVSLVAGIGSGGAFAVGPFLTALEALARTFLVMVLGFGLALAITPLRLRRSLEQLLIFRGRQPLAVQKFILTVTLMLRFIPMFLGEWMRFSRYATARSKEASLTLRSAPRRLTNTALPFLLSLFRLGDQAADALESRGVGRRSGPTLRRTLRWRRRDTALALGALAAAALLRLWG